MDFILSWPNQIINVDRPTKMISSYEH